MTRINLVPVEELSNQHLVAEYRELPRCIKQKINTECAPERYCLGTGHMRWGRKHSKFLLARYNSILQEMKYRWFSTNFNFSELEKEYFDKVEKQNKNDYTPDEKDMNLSRSRIYEKIMKSPELYVWTKREIPEWVFRGV